MAWNTSKKWHSYIMIQAWNYQRERERSILGTNAFLMTPNINVRVNLSQEILWAYAWKHAIQVLWDIIKDCHCHHNYWSNIRIMTEHSSSESQVIWHQQFLFQFQEKLHTTENMWEQPGLTFGQASYLWVHVDVFCPGFTAWRKRFSFSLSFFFESLSKVFWKHYYREVKGCN